MWNVTTGRVLIESVIALDTKLNPHSCLIANYGSLKSSRISRGVRATLKKLRVLHHLSATGYN